MNQIPNIEETHNTRERIEEMKTLNDKLNDILGELILAERKEKIVINVPAIDKAKVQITETFHHQLQKAREEERERVEKDLDRRLEIQKKVLHSEYEGGYTHALQDVKEAIHSELDQDNK